MFWNASTLKDYAIEASDGRLGTVSDLLFEDVGWVTRWLVVDTGRWLPDRKVLLPLSALGQPDRAAETLPVNLTMQQVEDSPDIATDQPVSRQMEASVYNHYNWDAYWVGGGFDAMATPVIAPLWPTPQDAVGADAKPGNADPHLRSIAAVTGYHIHATDGAIGHVEDFLMDDAGWAIRYLIADTRNWRHGQKVLVSSRSVREIDWADGLVRLDVDRRKVKESPPYDPSIAVNRAYEEEFLTYYGIKWVAA